MNQFPVLSESFINQEVIGLRERGLSIETFALNPPSAESLNVELGFLQQSTFYILSQMSSRRVLKGHLYFLWHYPRRYFKTWRFAWHHRTRGESVVRAAWRAAVKKKELTKVQRQNVLLHFLLIAPVARIMLDRHFDLVHAQFADSAASLALLAAMLLDLPFSFTAHAYDIFTPQVIFKEKMQRASFIITCTQYNRQYLLEKYPEIDAAKIFVNLHGINLAKFRREAKPKGSPPLILTVGRLVQKKGIALLVFACKLLKEQGVSFRCRIIGDGPERPRLEMQIRLNHLLDCVEITGFLPPTEVKQAYQEARLFVLPCIVDEEGNRDGIPNVLAEAMAMEVPVISTAISGIPELVENGISGILLEQPDAAELAEKIRTLLASPKKRSQLAKAGRQRVEEIFDAERNLQQLKDIFFSQLRP